MVKTTRRFQLHIYIAVLFLGLLFAFAVTNISLQYIKTRSMMLSVASELFKHIDGEIRGAISTRYDVSILAANLYSESAVMNATTLAERMTRLPSVLQYMEAQPSISALYTGYENGSFFFTRRVVPDTEETKRLKPPPGADYMVWNIERDASGKTTSRFIFIDKTSKVLETRTIPDETYDPRTRPWYKEALAASDTILTSPYVFFTTKEVGTTFARRRLDSGTVVGVDVTLASLSTLLDSLKPTPSAELVIFDANRRIVADSTMRPRADGAATLADLPKLSASSRPVLAQIADGDLDRAAGMVTVEGDKGVWHGSVSRLDEPGPPLYLAVAAPQAELLAQAVRIRNQSLLVALIELTISMAATLACARLASRPLRALTTEAAAIRALKFDQPIEVRSHIVEIDDLAQTMESMKATIRRFLGIGAALAGERNFDRLLERLLVETAHLASARGGIVYLAEADGTLKAALAHWDDEPVAVNPPDLDPMRDRTHPVIRSIAAGSLSQLLNLAELGQLFPGFSLPHAVTGLATPLRNRHGEIVGALLLLQNVGALGDAQESEVLALVEAISGTAAAAIDSQRLILEQKQLIEAVIELMANAIDRKSPYTGGHCHRVPELTKMIARAAEAATDGPFKDFALDEEEWEELHIAAWLHDCGKLTSPEYIVDKATKLETIYDRLHEVRMRFEVIKREAEADCWRDIANGAPREPLLATLQSLWKQLDAEFAFVAECNEGGEFMAADKITKLRRIAERTWTRTLDDRIGLSEEERRRKAWQPPVPLPAVESLLADKPEHVFERRPEDRITPDNQWGFKIDVPAALYNRGEVYNLTIGRGTLTNEDRYKINEHIVETIRMLSHLPLPRHLRHVVEIASGHHEKMDGTGYPRRLSRDQMSLPARMMAVADIFEALTASDRPYKKPKTLSESLTIMARMRDDAHIDPEIFDLVLSAKVYLAYAEKFLPDDQIDTIDPELYRRRA